MKTKVPTPTWRAMLLTAWVLCGIESWAQPFTNGGFESVIGSPIPANTAQTLNPGDTWLPGWSAGGPDGAVEIQNGIDGFQIGQDLYGMAPWQGQQWAIFPNDVLGGTLSQTFQTSVGSYCTVQFESGYVYESANPLLGVAVTAGNEAILTNNFYDLSFRQWTSNQVSFIATSTSTILTFSDVSSQAGGADIGLDGVTLVAEPPGWPYVITQPLNQTNGAGSNVTFTASAGGNPATVQWYFGSNAIVGATNTTLMITASATNGGNYVAVFSNGIGTNATLPAVLTVLAITNSPVSQTAGAGTSVTFIAGANLPLAKPQWFFDGNMIAGQTYSTLGVIASGQTAGTYTVQFTYGMVTDTSPPAILTVTNIPFANGSFESVKGGAIPPGNDEGGNPGDQWLTGWAFGGSTNEIFVFNGPFESAGPEDGSQWVVFDSENAPPGGIVFQSFSTTVGDTYQVGYWTVAVYDDGNPFKSLTATAETPTGLILASNAVAPGINWSSNQLTFVAQSIETTLAFADTSIPNLGPSVGLDNVSVEDLSVIAPPPPPENLLTAIGLAGGGTSFVMQLNGTTGKSYIIETSTNLKAWSPVSTNIASDVNITNAIMAGAKWQFWKAIPAE